MQSRQERYNRYIKPLLQKLKDDGLLTPDLQKCIDLDFYANNTKNLGLHIGFLYDLHIPVSANLLQLYIAFSKKEKTPNLGKLRNLIEGLNNKKILSEANLKRMLAYLPFGGEVLINQISRALKAHYDGRHPQARFDDALNELRLNHFNLLFKAARCLLLSDHFPAGLAVHMLKEMNRGYEGVVNLQPLVTTVLAKRNGLFAMPVAQPDAAHPPLQFSGSDAL